MDHNPCSGLFFDIKKGLNRRPPFNVEQLNVILQSPLFNGFARNGKEHQAGQTRADDWRYWCPIVCLFTGARIGEIAQLNIGDVDYQNGRMIIHIREQEKANQTTKSRQSRVTVAHRLLIELGFEHFVSRRREQCKGETSIPLFDGLMSNLRGQIGAIPSRFWRNYLTRIGVKNGADGFGSHSFRHGLADQLRMADYLDDEIEVVLGHNQPTVTAGYGIIKQGTVNRIASMIDAVQFAGVSFAHLLPTAEL